VPSRGKKIEEKISYSDRNTDGDLEMLFEIVAKLKKSLHL